MPLSTPSTHSEPAFSQTDVWQTPLPALDSVLDRLLVRLTGALARRQVRRIRHDERLLPAADPFILALNHSSRREVVYLIAILMLIRGGQPVHFLADWNFRLIPGVGYLYDHSGAITVTRKPAKPAFLNRLRPLYASDLQPYEQARRLLDNGASIALFPEGTINRRADRLLPPRSGVARLALATGTPVLPVGIRFAGTLAEGARVDSGSPLEITVGMPLTPPACAGQPGRALIADFKTEIMAAIAPLCGKTPVATRADSRISVPSLHPLDQTDHRGQASC